MYNKVVISVLQNILRVQKHVDWHSDFKSLGATPADINWIMFETEQRLKVQLPETAITRDSTITDLIKTVVNRAA